MNCWRITGTSDEDTDETSRFHFVYMYKTIRKLIILTKRYDITLGSTLLLSANGVEENVVAVRNVSTSDMRRSFLLQSRHVRWTS
jgi:hypothetical protein